MSRHRNQMMMLAHGSAEVLGPVRGSATEGGERGDVNGGRGRGRGRGRGGGPRRGGPLPGGPGRGGPGRGFGGRGFGGGFEGPGAFGPGGGGRGNRARRGDTRDAVLLLLLDGPRHGYQLMSEIAERSDGRWTPGPGSIYPVVKSLGDAGLVSVSRQDDRRMVELTDDGRVVAERRRDGGDAPWDRIKAEPVAASEQLHTAVRGLLGAVAQLAENGSAASIAAASKDIDRLRRSLYLVLAEDAPESEAGGTETDIAEATVDEEPDS